MQRIQLIAFGCNLPIHCLYSGLLQLVGHGLCSKPQSKAAGSKRQRRSCNIRQIPLQNVRSALRRLLHGRIALFLQFPHTPFFTLLRICQIRIRMRQWLNRIDLVRFCRVSMFPPPIRLICTGNTFDQSSKRQSGSQRSEAIPQHQICTRIVRQLRKSDRRAVRSHQCQCRIQQLQLMPCRLEFCFLLHAIPQCLSFLLRLPNPNT